jgi:mRNA-degrading endonuclease toxin of MazEF toxin-antitoxin module
VPGIERGTIVLAQVIDPQNRNLKTRPVAIITRTEDIRPSSTFEFVAITGTIPRPLPPDYVLLPWKREGHPVTGLTKKAAAVCSWTDFLTHENIIRRLGRVPPAQLLQILQKVASLRM